MRKRRRGRRLRFGRRRRLIACLPRWLPRGSASGADQSDLEVQIAVVDEAERDRLAELKLPLTEPRDGVQPDSLSVDMDAALRSVDDYDAPRLRRLNLRSGAQGDAASLCASRVPCQMQLARTVRT